MGIEQLRIGYVSYLPDLSQPGDRRRFPYFAKRFNIPFEIADPDKQYDVILLTAPSNLSRWLKYKKKNPQTKFLFEMVDSLIFYTNFISRWAKGTGRYMIGKEDSLFIDYSVLLKKWIQIADVVICSNEVLRKEVMRLNANAVLSPDYLESEYSIQKKNFDISGKMKLVWEGLPMVLHHYEAYKEMLDRVSSFCELHIISNRSYVFIPKWYSVHIDPILKRLPIETHFHQWDLSTHNECMIQGDCGIIPPDINDKLGWNKPANKLISYWFSGLPSIVSGTPAYKSVMDDAESSLYCNSVDEWVEKIKWMFELEPGERKRIAMRDHSYAKKNYPDSELDKIWVKIFSLIQINVSDHLSKVIV